MKAAFPFCFMNMKVTSEVECVFEMRLLHSSLPSDSQTSWWSQLQFGGAGRRFCLGSLKRGTSEAADSGVGRQSQGPTRCVQRLTDPWHALSSAGGLWQLAPGRTVTCEMSLGPSLISRPSEQCPCLSSPGKLSLLSALGSVTPLPESCLLAQAGPAGCVLPCPLGMSAAAPSCSPLGLS